MKPDGLVMRALRDDVDRADLEELRLYGRPGDLVVAGMTEPPAAGFSDLGFEGYARKAPTTGGRPLNLYYNAKTDDYLSTLIDPPADYELIRTIGYALPPESN
jgi:hypothetical protein